MDKRTHLDRLASGPEERLLLGRIWDKYEQCRRRSIPAGTGFLSPAEQAAAQRLLNSLSVADGFAFWGGWEGAQRRQLWFLPDWMTEPEADAVCLIRSDLYEADQLTHRDVLGSLMGLGLTRDAVGDILVAPKQLDVLVTAPAAEFLLGQWREAGRIRLHPRRAALEELEPPEERVKRIRDTVSSLRLDSVLAAGFSLSRGKAAEAVSARRVQLNWTDCLKPDRPVAQGDTLTIRGLGKCVLEEVGQETKKGRLFVTIKRYL